MTFLSSRSNRRFRLLLTAAVALAPLAHAQSPSAPAVRIGYVDMKRLLDNAPQIVAGRSKLENEFAGRDAALKADEKHLADLRGSVALQPDETRQREIDALERSIKRQREKLHNELKARSDQELDNSWREINDAVVAFAREQGYDLIVASPVVFASERVDVTDKILDRLRRQASKGAKP